MVESDSSYMANLDLSHAYRCPKRVCIVMKGNYMALALGDMRANHVASLGILH
jgi:hypothetical protein